MSVIIIVGAQWGDEGKGHIVDLLSEKSNIVARYQGGANAGHTVRIGDKEYVLHLIPSGIFYPHVTCVIGNGVVLDPLALEQELTMLQTAGIDVGGRLLISSCAHLILPYHKQFDALHEREQGAGKIGTTGRGIGPAYVDKCMRIGIRADDLLDRDVLALRLRAVVQEKNQILTKIYGEEPLDIDALMQQCEGWSQLLGGFITDTPDYLNRAIKKGLRILAEGAQGGLLDVDHGTYPFVTSSNPTAGGACTGLGIPPTAIDATACVLKAYTTRVGNGPFPTELHDEIGEHLRSVGHEYGATTGRPRRCGWFDSVVSERSVMINGIEAVALTKADVMAGLDSVCICVGYKHRGRMLKRFPESIAVLAECEPVYERMDGWPSIQGVTSENGLPRELRLYIQRLEQLLKVPVVILSTGPERSQTIIRSAQLPSVFAWLKKLGQPAVAA